MSALVRAMGDSGAVGDGGDDTTALQDALDKIEAAGGGTLLFEEPPVGYGIRRPLKVPKVDITIQGRGINTAIVAHGLGASESVLTWKKARNNVDHGFFLDSLKIIRDTSGRALDFSPTKSYRRWRGTISNVWLQQPNDGSPALRHLEQALNCRVESAVLGEGSSARPGLYLNDNANSQAPTDPCLLEERTANELPCKEDGRRCILQRRLVQFDGGFFAYPFLNMRNSGFGAHTRRMREVGIGHVFVFSEDCDNIVVSAFFSGGHATQNTHTGRTKSNFHEIKGARTVPEHIVTAKHVLSTSN